MTTKDKILLELRKGGACDDCLSLICDVKPRQQANQRCADLSVRRLIIRQKEICPRCGTAKIVNRIPDKDSFTTELAHETSAGSDNEGMNARWCTEANIQKGIVLELTKRGYRILKTSRTETREQGKDIEAASPEGHRLWITVKGYPEKSQHTQARHWFSQGLFDLILYREEDAGVALGIGLPDGYSTYLNLAKRATWFKKAAGYNYYWVAQDGTVRLE